MSILSAGKGHTKYNIHLSNKKISKNILNKFLSNKNKVLIITDSGVPKKFLRSLKKDINTKYQYSMILEKGEKSKSFKTYQYILNSIRRRCCWRHNWFCRVNLSQRDRLYSNSNHITFSG